MKLRGITATVVCVLAAGVGVTVPAGIADADPSNGHTATYSFTQCVDSTGRSVADFEAVKQFGQAAALHLLDGRGNFIAESNPPVSERNFTPTSTACESFTEAVAGIAVSLQIERDAVVVKLHASNDFLNILVKVISIIWLVFLIWYC